MKTLKFLGMMSLLLMSVCTFTACGSDDEDNGGGTSGIEVPVTGQVGWNGNVENGTSTYVPSGSATASYMGGTAYCEFKASNGVCTAARAYMMFDNADKAQQMYQWLLEDDEDDDDDYYAKKNVRIMKHAASRAGVPSDIGIYINGKYIYFDLPLVGKNMDDNKKVIDIWEKNASDANIDLFYSPLFTEGNFDLATLPASPYFGTIDNDLNYECTTYSQGVYRVGFGITKVKTNFLWSAGGIVGVVYVLEFESAAAAKYFIDEDPDAFTSIDNDDETFYTVLDGKTITMTTKWKSGEAAGQLVKDYFRHFLVYQDLIINEPIGWILFFEGFDQ